MTPSTAHGARPGSRPRSPSCSSDTDDFTSAQDLHARLRGAGQTVGLATVYRTLQAMADAGRSTCCAPTTARPSTGRCSTGHHHHLVCRACGRTVEVEGPAVEHWADKVAPSTASPT